MTRARPLCEWPQWPRYKSGDVNRAGARTSRTLRDIASANIFTRFNAILGAALLAECVVERDVDPGVVGVRLDRGPAPAGVGRHGVPHVVDRQSRHEAHRLCRAVLVQRPRGSTW